MIWHDRRERRIVLKTVFFTVSGFLVAATIQFGLIVKNLHPANIILPIVVGTIVGLLLGYNALLRQRLQKSNNTKTQFLARMNHELRTPMNAILGFAHLLEEEPNLTTQQKEEVGRIVLAGNHLLNLINELLEFASVETGKVKIHSESINVAATADECLDIIGPLAAKKGVSLQHDIGDYKGLRVMADELRLKQILINLFSNAVKYNRDNGELRVYYEVNGSNFRISISDTGKGIAPNQLPYLFEPFNRLGAEETNIEGTGIGLSITKALIEMMDGAIGCTSEVGKGTTFCFELPLAAD